MLKYIFTKLDFFCLLFLYSSFPAEAPETSQVSSSSPGYSQPLGWLLLPLAALDCPGNISRLSFWGFSTSVEHLPRAGLGFTPCVHGGAEDETWHPWISVSLGSPAVLGLGLDFCSPSSCSIRFKGNFELSISLKVILLKSLLAEPKSGPLTFWQNLFSGWKISFLIRFWVVFLFDSKSLSWSSLKH